MTNKTKAQRNREQIREYSVPVEIIVLADSEENAQDIVRKMLHDNNKVVYLYRIAGKSWTELRQGAFRTAKW